MVRRISTHGVSNNDMAAGRTSKRFSRYRPGTEPVATKAPRRLSNDCQSVYSMGTQMVEGDDMSTYAYSVVDGTSVLNGQGGGGSVMGESLADDFSLYTSNLHADDMSRYSLNHDPATQELLKDIDRLTSPVADAPAIPTNICLSKSRKSTTSTSSGTKPPTSNNMNNHPHDGSFTSFTVNNQDSLTQADLGYEDAEEEPQGPVDLDDEETVPVPVPAPVEELPIPTQVQTRVRSRSKKVPPKKTISSDTEATDESSFEHEQRSIGTRPSIATTATLNSNSSLWHSQRGTKKQIDSNNKKKKGWLAKIFRKRTKASF